MSEFNRVSRGEYAYDAEEVEKFPATNRAPMKPDPGSVEFLYNIRRKLALRQACHIAQKSPDPSTKNGACLICDNGNWFTDCNQFSVLEKGGCVAPETPAELLADRNTKLAWIEHAERNAIFTAIRAGADVRGSTLYCPFASCADCARAIVLTGVAELVRMPRSVIPWPETWAASIERADKILAVGGVKVTDYTGPPLDMTYLVNKVEYKL